MKKYIFCFLSVLWCFSAFGQSKTEIDSLLKLLPKAKKDTNLALLYLDIGKAYEQSNHKTAAKYYYKAKKLSEEIGYERGNMLFAFASIRILSGSGKIDSLLIFEKQALEIAKKLENPLDIGRGYYNIGMAYWYNNMYDSAVVYYNRAQKYWENNPKYLANLNVARANLYSYLKRYAEARPEGDKALQYFRKEKDSLLIAGTLVNLAPAYIETADVEKGKKMLEEAIKIAEKKHYDDIKANAFNNLTEIYIKTDDSKIKMYAEKTLSYAKKSSNPRIEASAWNSLSIYYLRSGNFEKSLACLDSSLAISSRNNSLRDKAETLVSKAKTLYAMGKLKEGENVWREADSLQERIRGDEIQRRIVLSEKMFETERKEAQIKLQETQLKQKNTLNYIFAGSAGVALIIALLVYRNYKHRQKLQRAEIEELEKEKQLSAAQSLLKGQEDERSRLAKDLHDGLGGLLSGVKLQLGEMKENIVLSPENGTLFNRALGRLDESISEMRRVAHNMMPETLVKFGLQKVLQDYCNGLNASQNLIINTNFHGLEQRIDSTTEMMIYRIVQELVNNAVKHSAASSILVQVTRHEKLLSATVEDDGKGFDISAAEIKNSAGMQNIRSRIDYLRGKMDIQSQPGKGTSVYVECEVE
ncbi:MAG: histidine kinase [Flavobacteriaceae bacterium]|jgi:signal transduction histidine kinase|nr:histidine kinase [Flavobacteriaceae bacterium]